MVTSLRQGLLLRWGEHALGDQGQSQDLWMLDWAAQNKGPLAAIIYALKNKSQGIVQSRVNVGRWIVDCPDPLCNGAEYIWRGVPRRFFCLSCGNYSNGGLFYNVAIPQQHIQIEQLLAVRPHRDFQNWDISKSIQDLIEENSKGFHRSYTTPKTYSTGDVLTASDKNTYERDNISFLGGSHDHSGDSGDGGELGDVLFAIESASGTQSVSENSWTTLASVTFTLLADDIVLILGAITKVNIDESGSWVDIQGKIARTSGSGGTIVGGIAAGMREAQSSVSAWGGTCWAVFEAESDGTGSQTFAIQGYQDTSEGGSADNMTGNIVVIKMRKPATSF